MPSAVLSALQAGDLFSHQPYEVETTKLCLFADEEDSL